MKQFTSWAYCSLFLTFLVIMTTGFQPVKGQKFIELMQKENIKVKKLERKGKRYFQNRDKGKGSGYKLFMRNLYWAKRNADKNGRVIDDTKVVDERKAFRSSFQKKKPGIVRHKFQQNGWKELGPFNWTNSQSWNPGLGRITAIAVEPIEQKLIYVGSPGGGIWKSTDAGEKWNPMGDDMLNMEIYAIALDPNNSDIVYLGNTLGQVLKSMDGGTTWNKIFKGEGVARKILLHPDGDIIMIASSKGLYRSTDNGKSFTRVVKAKVEDIEFQPGNTNIVYTCGSDFFRSTDGGASFSKSSKGLTHSERMKLAVTPADPDVVYIVQKDDSAFGRLYRSTDAGLNFNVTIDNTTATDREIYFTQASRDMAIMVSDTDVNEVHLGGLNYSRSLDGGSTFTTLAAWNQTESDSYVHADIEVMQYINGTIYIGSDGGIFRSTNHGDNCADLTQGGLAVRQYYRIGGSATDANMIVGGAQDNGTNIMSGSDRKFKEWLGGDGMECFIDPKDSDIVYGTTQEGNLHKSSAGGDNTIYITKPGQMSGEWVTPFHNDPLESKTIYAGYEDLYRSKDGGSSGNWDNMTSTIDIGGKLDEMAIAASDNNYIYIADKSRLWRTKNGQEDTPLWTEVSDFENYVNYIAVDPNNPEHVAIATTGTGVYVSTDAGNVWKKITGNLPRIAAQCLVFDDTDKNGLYVGMQSGVYYTNDTLAEWVPFSENLPAVLTSELEIHYPSRKIRVATYGRGIWEANLYDDTGDNQKIKTPPNFTVTIVDSDAKLSWGKSNMDIDGFEIERSNGGSFVKIGEVAIDVRRFRDKKLTPGTYTYRIRAKRDNKFSAYSIPVSVAIKGDKNSSTVFDDCIGCRVYETNSEETTKADYKKEYAIDSDLTTFWHTAIEDENIDHPHYVAIDLGQTQNLVGFSYTARQELNASGAIKGFEFFGWDGTEWKQLVLGQFQKTPKKQSFEFDAFSCRYVYLRSVSAIDGKRWASIAEFSVRYLSNLSKAPYAGLRSIHNETPPAVELNKHGDLEIYPVPFQQELHIKGLESKKSIRSVRILGVDGFTYKPKYEYSNGNMRIDTRPLSNGIYILSYEDKGISKSVKIIKN